MGKKIKNIAAIIAMCVLFYFVGYAMGNFLHSSELPRGIFGIIVGIASFIICFVLQVFVHELGHLVAGKMSGYKLLWFGVFNTTFVKKNGKLMRTTMKHKGVLGHCLMSPPEMKNGKYPFVFYVLGGGLMNFLVSAISLAIYFIFLPQFWILVMFAGVGIMIGVSNIVPMNIGGLTNDGYDILKRCKSEAERRSFWYMSRFFDDYINKDMRPRDISEEQLALFSGVSQDDTNQEDSAVAVAEHFRLGSLLDKQEFEKAKALAEKLLNTPDDTLALLKNEFLCTLLLLELIGECRKEEVERLYTKELKQYIEATSFAISRQLLLYAYAKLFLQDDAQAKKALEKFNKMALTYPFRGEIEGSREMIELVDKLAVEKKNFQ